MNQKMIDARCDAESEWAECCGAVEFLHSSIPNRTAITFEALMMACESGVATPDYALRACQEIARELKAEWISLRAQELAR